MRFNINLASSPYENARRFFLRWGAGLLVLLAITAALVFAAARSWRVNHALSRSISEERARLEKLNAEERADLAILDEGGNKDIRDRSQALNALLVRKSFSWTRIFNDMETMMPGHLHVISIAPQLNAQNQLEIRMVVGGDSRDKAIELVQHMEEAPDFREPQIISENSAVKTTGGIGPSGDAVTFNIVAQYTPTAASAASTKTAEAKPEESASPAATKVPDAKGTLGTRPEAKKDAVAEPGKGAPGAGQKRRTTGRGI